MSTEKKWFEATVLAAHTGAGRKEISTIYLYAYNTLAARNILLNDTRGWKRSRGVRSLCECSSEKVESLLEEISTCSRVSLSQVMSSGYFYGN